MITNILLGITIAFSYLALRDASILNRWMHAPYLETHKGEYMRLLSSGFLHGSMNHLLINMFVLWQFGSFLESYLNTVFGPAKGPALYVTFYLTAIIAANIGSLIKHKNNPQFRSLGASGVTSAIVLIYCLFDPWQMFLFPPVPAILFAVLYLGYSQWAIYNSSDNIDHQGHLWGSLYGIFFILVFNPTLFTSFMKKLTTWPF